MKSSLKFCVVSACEFDGYVAEPRAYEWEIAAGHAILENAGGSTVIQGEYISTGQIKRGSPEASEIDGTNFVDNGEFVINLVDGTINTPKFKVKGSTGDAEFKGSVKGGSFEGTNSLLTSAGDKITVGNNVTIDGENQQIKITDASGATRVVLGKL